MVRTSSRQQNQNVPRRKARNGNQKPTTGYTDYAEYAKKRKLTHKLVVTEEKHTDGTTHTPTKSVITYHQRNNLKLPPKNQLVALDTETSGLHPDDDNHLSVVSLAWRDQNQQLQTAVYPFDHGTLNKTNLPKGTQTTLTETNPNLTPQDFQTLGQRLQTCQLVGHNLKFDLLFCWKGLRNTNLNWDLAENAAWDTSLLNALLWPNEHTALKTTAARLWGTQEKHELQELQNWLKNPKNKTKDRQNKTQPRYDLAPWELLEPYAAKDAELTLRLAEHQWQLVQEGQLSWQVIKRELNLAKVLHQLEKRGVGFDKEAAKEEANKLEQRAAQLALTLPFQPPTLTQAKTYFFQTLNHPPSKLTPAGKPSLDEEATRTLQEQNVPGAETWATYTKLQSALTKWYKGWSQLCGEDNRLRCVFHQTKSEGRGTVTGRLSVQRVQLQAIPHDYQLAEGVKSVRSLFQAKPNKELWECDLSQAEFRVAAALAKETKMLQQFKEGHDAHDGTCRLVFEIEPDNPKWEEYRAVAKRLGFGILYGAGARTIQEELAKSTGLNVSVDQVNNWLGRYENAMPNMLRMGKTAEHLANKRGYVVLAGGRQRWFSQGEETRKAWNAVVQGSVAELMKEAMVNIEKNHPGTLVSQVHDSVWLEVDNQQHAETVGQLLTQTFENHYNNVVAFPTGNKKLA